MHLQSSSPNRPPGHVCCHTRTPLYQFTPCELLTLRLVSLRPLPCKPVKSLHRFELAYYSRDSLEMSPSSDSILHPYWQLRPLLCADRYATQAWTPCCQAHKNPTFQMPLGGARCAASQGHPSLGCNRRPHSRPQECLLLGRYPAPATPQATCLLRNASPDIKAQQMCWRALCQHSCTHRYRLSCYSCF